MTFVDVGRGAGVTATCRTPPASASATSTTTAARTSTSPASASPTSSTATTATAPSRTSPGPSGVGAGNFHHSGCAMADFNGDGFLDMLVGNTYDDWLDRRRSSWPTTSTSSPTSSSCAGRPSRHPVRGRQRHLGHPRPRPLGQPERRLLHLGHRGRRLRPGRRHRHHVGRHQRPAPGGQPARRPRLDPRAAATTAAPTSPTSPRWRKSTGRVLDGPVLRRLQLRRQHRRLRHQCRGLPVPAAAGDGLPPGRPQLPLVPAEVRPHLRRPAGVDARQYP